MTKFIDGLENLKYLLSGFLKKMFADSDLEEEHFDRWKKKMKKGLLVDGTRKII